MPPFFSGVHPRGPVTATGIQQMLSRWRKQYLQVKLKEKELRRWTLAVLFWLISMQSSLEQDHGYQQKQY